MDNVIVYEGYVAHYDCCLKRVEIRKDAAGFYSAWVDNELQDQIDGSDRGTFVTEFTEEWGASVYDTVADFKADRDRTIGEVVP